MGPTHWLAAGVLLTLGVSSSNAQEVELVAGGDVEWSRIVQVPSIYWHPEEEGPGGWHRIPYLSTEESRALLQSRGRTLTTPETHHVAALQYGLEFDSPLEMARYPFRRIGPLFRDADIAFVNLESPLSLDARRSGAFLTHPAFADGLRWAGIDVVSTANNHALDAEGQGVLDTRSALQQAGVGAVGTGKNLSDARRPFVIERDGLRLAFLAYANYLNSGASGFATLDRSGAVPLDPLIIEEDIARVRDQVDFVILSFHWGIENTADPAHPEARAFAHRMLDAGADVILGHGPHLPRAIEVREGKVVFYSLGNLIFGHNHDYWGDNIVARVRLASDAIQAVEVIPVAGQGRDLSQPFVLEGDRATRVLRTVREQSEAWGTSVEIRGDVGVVEPRSLLPYSGGRGEHRQNPEAVARSRRITRPPGP